MWPRRQNWDRVGKLRLRGGDSEGRSRGSWVEMKGKQG